MSAPPPLIDRAVLDDLFEAVEAAAARSVLGLFLNETEAYLARVAAAAAAPDDPARRQEARRAAHTLKSSAGQVGATALAAAAAEVERLAATGAPGLAAAAAALQHCAAATGAALQPYLTGAERQGGVSAPQ